jgi:hypothetical protein
VQVGTASLHDFPVASQRSAFYLNRVPGAGHSRLGQVQLAIEGNFLDFEVEVTFLVNVNMAPEEGISVAWSKALCWMIAET